MFSSSVLKLAPERVARPLKNSTGGGCQFSTLSSSIATFSFFSINVSAGLQVKKHSAKNNQLIAEKKKTSLLESTRCLSRGLNLQTDKRSL